MAKNDAVWGIDLGNCALKAIKLRELDGQLLVEALEVIEHKQICSTVEDVGERSNMIREALEQFSMRQSTAGDTVVVSLSGQTSFARFIKLPPVEPKKIPEIVQFEAMQQIPFPINEVVWDFQTLQHEDSPDVEVGIFAVKTEQVNSLVELFSSAGVKVDIVQAAPLALYNFVRHDDLIGDQTTVVVDIGTATTDLVVTDQQRVWLRNIPLGGNNFTEALVKAFKLNFSKAEHLKRTAATSKYARQIFQAMRPVFDDLVGELNRSFGHYKSTNREAKLERIIGLGSAFKLPGLQKFLRQNLSLEVERVESFKGASAAGGVSPAMLTEHVPSFSVAYGLALQGLQQGAIQSSLLPMPVVRERSWRQKRSWFAAAAACVVMGVLAMGMRHLKTKDDINSAMENAQQEINTPIKNAQKYKTEYSQKKSAGTEELRRIESVTSVTRQRAFVPELYQMICRSFPLPQEELLADAKAIPRGERRQIFVEHLRLTYAANVDLLLESGTSRDRNLQRNQRRRGFGGYGRGGFGGGMPGMPGGMGAPGGMMGGGFGRGGMGGGGGTRDPSFYMNQAKVIATPGEEVPTKPGFLAEMAGTTPNQDTNFVTTSLLNQIRQIHPSKNSAHEFYVDKVEMLKLDPLVAEMATAQNTAPRRGNVPGMFGTAAQPAPEEIGIRDPLTNERVERDYRFEARWVIYMGTREENEKAENSGEEAVK